MGKFRKMESLKSKCLAAAILLVAMAALTEAITPKVIQGVVEAERKMTLGGVPGNASKECVDAIDILFLPTSTQLKEYVFDAFGKPQAGILQGNLHWLGHYDECRSIKVPEYNIQYKYCATFFDVNFTAITKTKSPEVLLAWGVCVPKECTETDIQNYLYVFVEMLNLTKYIEPANDKSFVSCAYEDHIPYSAGFVGTITLFSAIFLLMLLGAAYDCYLRYHRKNSSKMVVYTNTSTNNSAQNGRAGEAPINDDTAETKDDDTPLILVQEPPKHAIWEQFLLSFALNRNLAKLLNTNPGADRTIGCLNGLRVISMAWVILGHTFFFPSQMGIIGNLPTAVGWYQTFGFQVVGNAFFSVDSFFFMSGLLLTYITLKKMAKTSGKIPWAWFYFHRYWRLTPAILITTLIWMYIKPWVGDGPLWRSFQNTDSCIKYWWTNILYINNFYPQSFMHECIGWVWYLANDMQFFIISPFILVPLYFLPWLGLSLIGVLLAGSFAVTGALVGINKLGANGIAIPGVEATGADFSSVIYGKPYCRIPPYLVGMILGYLMYKQGDRRIRLNPALVSLGWTVATVIGMSCVYGLLGAYKGDLTLAGSILYEMLSRFAWAVSLSWLVFACREGYGGWVDDILSWSFWLPLSRVTYSAYLLHPIIIYIFLGNVKNTQMASLWLQPTYFVGYFVMSYGAAVVMALFIEFPFANLEKLFVPARRG
ncbi:nose resistant to fluoxetine protein 6 [Strongylocentrotus purpuratus]|uniref:Nose resistant-to-fluoxetine protein N-terminal domain-containing protein n=1 Tax=Strongylocentrotus purpuratus TaxID=7668 RepID=A0A7M7N5D5_STRPU|nr:nose resistant to fluoxetine protein 6 [Strongylocentrotus purpuratus]